MLDVTDYAYGAGVLDGEGTVYIGKNGGINIEVEMSEDNAVYRMSQVFGGKVSQLNRVYDSGRTAYRWRIHGENALEAASLMLPYSTTKKRQLEVLTTFARNYPADSNKEHRAEAKNVARLQLQALKEPEPQVITLDIETMGLDWTTKRMLSCTFQSDDLEAFVWTEFKTGPYDDGEQGMLVKTRDILESAAWTMGFNSLRFDIPYINYRLSLYEERPMFLGSHVDVSETYKKLTGRSKRTSLYDMSNELGTADEEVHKTPIDWDIWNAADAGDPGALRYVVNHADMDVILTKRGYEAIRKIQHAA